MWLSNGTSSTGVRLCPPAVRSWSPPHLSQHTATHRHLAAAALRSSWAPTPAPPQWTGARAPWSPLSTASPTPTSRAPTHHHPHRHPADRSGRRGGSLLATTHSSAPTAPTAPAPDPGQPGGLPKEGGAALQGHHLDSAPTLAASRSVLVRTGLCCWVYGAQGSQCGAGVRVGRRGCGCRQARSCWWAWRSWSGNSWCGEDSPGARCTRCMWRWGPG